MTKTQDRQHPDLSLEINFTGVGSEVTGLAFVWMFPNNGWPRARITIFHNKKWDKKGHKNWSSLLRLKFLCEEIFSVRRAHFRLNEGRLDITGIITPKEIGSGIHRVARRMFRERMIGWRHREELTSQWEQGINKIVVSYTNQTSPLPERDMDAQIEKLKLIQLLRREPSP